MYHSDGDTHCFGCIFAVKEHDEETNMPTQIGCKIGKLEQYEDNGVQLIEAYNEEENYYVIPKKFCSFDRNNNWAAKSKLYNHKDWEKLAEKEMVGRLVEIIVLVNQGDDNNSELVYLLSQIELQKIAPVKVHLCLIDPEQNGRPANYINALSQYKFKWKFHHFVGPTGSYYECVNKVAEKVNSLYYAVFTPYFPLPRNFVEKLFDREYKQLKGFIYAKYAVGSDNPKCELDGLVIKKKVHKMVGGNSTLNVMEKVDKLVEEQNISSDSELVINFEDLFK